MLQLPGVVIIFLFLGAQVPNLLGGAWFPYTGPTRIKCLVRKEKEEGGGQRSAGGEDLQSLSVQNVKLLTGL